MSEEKENCSHQGDQFIQKMINTFLPSLSDCKMGFLWENIMLSCNQKLHNKVHTYSDKLRLAKPQEFWHFLTLEWFIFQLKYSSHMVCENSPNIQC